LVGEDQFPIGEDVEHAESAHTDSGLDTELLLNEFFQAPGPGALLGSKQTAFDFNVHAYAVLGLSFEWGFGEPVLGDVLKILRTIHSGATKT